MLSHHCYAARARCYRCSQHGCCFMLQLQVYTTILHSSTSLLSIFHLLPLCIFLHDPACRGLQPSYHTLILYIYIYIYIYIYCCLHSIHLFADVNSTIVLESGLMQYVVPLLQSDTDDITEKVRKRGLVMIDVKLM